MSLWINKLTYNNNIDDVPEEFDIGTTFDKVYYKNEEGIITHFSLADFVKHIKTFFNEKRFMIWGSNQPLAKSNTVEWYQTEIIRNPIAIPLVISQTYNDDTAIQPGIYTLKRLDSNSPLFSNQDGKDKVETINFKLTNENNQEQEFILRNTYYLDSESEVNSSDSDDYYSYILQNDVTGDAYFIGIKIAYDINDEEDRIISSIRARSKLSAEGDWKRYYPTENVLPENLIKFEFDIDKYYTINFKIEENSQENFLTLYATPNINGQYLWANIEIPEELDNYLWITQDGSLYNFNTATITAQDESSYNLNTATIIGDLTLFATSNSSSNQGTDEEQSQETDGEQSQGTDENN